MTRAGVIGVAAVVAATVLGSSPAGAVPKPSPKVAKQMWALQPDVPVRPQGDLVCYRDPRALGVWKRKAGGRRWGLINLTTAGCANAIIVVSRRSGSSKWMSVTSFGYMPITDCAAFERPISRIDVPPPIMRRLTAVFGRCGQVEL